MSTASPTRQVKRGSNVGIRLALEQDDLLSRLAEIKFKGSRSAAVSHLIDVHAGKEIERALLEAETLAAPVRVITWKPPKLTRELIAYVAGLVRAGNVDEAACDLAGITPKQRSTWLKMGRNDRREGHSSLYADFVAAIVKAEAECEAETVASIRSWRDRNWRASAWLLERQRPERYAQRKIVDGKILHSLMPLVDYDRLTAAETKTLVELLRKASPELDDPSVGRSSRPAIELVPEDVIDAVDGQWHEIVEPEAPALESGPLESAPAEAPALETDSAEAPALEKPEH